MPLQPNKNKAKILYIEDNPVNAALIERILTSFGYELTIARNGLEGINAALSHSPDLILMDLDLPDLTGFEVTMRLRELEDFRRTPIIAITAQHDDDYKTMSRISGLSGYITKPVNVQDLCEKVESYLDEKNDTATLDIDLEEGIYDRNTFEQLMFKIRELEETNNELRSNNRELVEQLVTKLRQAEATNNELRRLDKIKDDFIQRTAHELRTPLTVIVGYTRVLESTAAFVQATTNDPMVGQYMQALIESIERMRKVVDEIVMISRLASGKIEVAQANLIPSEIAQQALRTFQQALKERNMNVDFEAVNWPTKLKGDADLIRMALINLIGNAIKYTPDGGKITLSAEQHGIHLRLSIKDTGIGIDPQEQRRIFDSFYSPDNVKLHSTSKTAFRGGGLGLGLATTKAIVEAHGGKIWVESIGKDEDKLPGSTFFIDLPIEGGKADKAAIYKTVSGASS